MYGLKQHEFVVLRVLWVRSLSGPPWAKIKLWSRLYFFLETLGKNPFLCLFQLLLPTHIPWLMAPSFMFKLVVRQLSDPSSRHFSLWPYRKKGFCFSGFMWLAGPTHLIQDNHLPISNSLIYLHRQSSFCHVSFTGSADQATGIFEADIILMCTVFYVRWF